MLLAVSARVHARDGIGGERRPLGPRACLQQPAAGQAAPREIFQKAPHPREICTHLVPRRPLTSPSSPWAVEAAATERRSPTGSTSSKAGRPPSPLVHEDGGAGGPAPTRGWLSAHLLPAAWGRPLRRPPSAQQPQPQSATNSLPFPVFCPTSAHPLPARGRRLAARLPAVQSRGNCRAPWAQLPFLPLLLLGVARSHLLAAAAPI